MGNLFCLGILESYICLFACMKVESRCGKLHGTLMNRANCSSF